ncbi:MAG: hypothetical protein M1831_000215 [Alyxoria varia]|nr:MAG: hypothetical protein M1831_000215 [Alyxoria varia]
MFKLVVVFLLLHILLRHLEVNGTEALHRLLELSHPVSTPTTYLAAIILPTLLMASIFLYVLHHVLHRTATQDSPLGLLRAHYEARFKEMRAEIFHEEDTSLEFQEKLYNTYAERKSLKAQIGKLTAEKREQKALNRELRHQIQEQEKEIGDLQDYTNRMQGVEHTCVTCTCHPNNVNCVDENDENQARTWAVKGARGPMSKVVPKYRRDVEPRMIDIRRLMDEPEDSGVMPLLGYVWDDGDWIKWVPEGMEVERDIGKMVPEYMLRNEPKGSKIMPRLGYDYFEGIGWVE